MTALAWDDFVASISRLGGVVELGDVARKAISEVADYLEARDSVTEEDLVVFISQDPERVPLLALAVRLSREQLKNNLRNHFGTTSWARLSRERPQDVIMMFDQEFGLMEKLESDRRRSWSYADILAERYMSRLKASGAITRGRDLEDAVEAIVDELGLAHHMRTRFVGRGGDSAPCDLAIPSGEDKAEIVVGIKGFDSTGSKLTDATREVQAMASIRRPTQFVFVVLDGIGWKSRESDLKRIHRLWDEGSIDGVYTTQRLGDFRSALLEAARRRDLI